MTYSVDRVTAFSGNQVIVWLKDESTGRTVWEDGLTRCVRVDIAEAPTIIGELIMAYTTAMQRTLMDVAAGGCRTCSNTRRVGRNPFADLAGDVTGEPCPTCTPRAETRIRRAAHIGSRASHRNKS